jgi:hypothetical protein
MFKADWADGKAIMAQFGAWQLGVWLEEYP